MTYKKILRELAAIISAATTPQLSILNIMNFLLGEEIDRLYDQEDNEQEVAMLHQSTFYEIYNGNRSLSPKYLYYFARSSNWSIKRLEEYCPPGTVFNSKAFKDSLKKLYKQYFSLQTGRISISDTIKKLLCLYFVGIPDIRLCFFPYNQNVCSYYIPLVEKESILAQYLEENNIVFVNGMPGAGKTQFIKHYIKKMGYNPYQVGWLDSSYEQPSLFTYIQNLKLLCNSTDTENNKIFDCLEKMDSSFLLVIDIPHLSFEDYQYVEEYLSKIELRVIIITKTLNIPRKYCSLNIDNLPETILFKIFQEIYPESFLNEAEFSKLVKIINSNPFILSLIAKSKKKNKNAFSKDNLINSPDWLWYQTGLPKIHNPYKDTGKKSASTITNLAYRLISSYPESFFNDDFLSRLSLWTKYEISQTILEKIFDSSKITAALDYGILQYSNSCNMNLVMPNIIADTIWDNFPIDFAEYEDQIRRALNAIMLGQSFTVPYTTMINITLNMVYRFHHNICLLKTHAGKREKNLYNRWNNLLLELSCHFTDLGDLRAANSLLDRLYICFDQKNNAHDTIQPMENALKNLSSFKVQLQKSPKEIDDILDYLVNLTFDKKHWNFQSRKAFYFVMQINNLICDIINFWFFTEHEYAFSIFGKPWKMSSFISDMLVYLKRFLDSGYFDNDYINYYSMLYNYTLAIYNDGNTRYYFQQKACAYFNASFCNEHDVYTELNFKAHLHKFYYELVLNYIDIIYKNRRAPSQIYDLYSFRYYRFYNCFMNRIHSKDTCQLFYIVNLLYQHLLESIKEPYIFDRCYYVTQYRISMALSSLSKYTTLSESEEKSPQQEL